MAGTHAELNRILQEGVSAWGGLARRAGKCCLPGMSHRLLQTYLPSLLQTYLPSLLQINAAMQPLHD